MVYKGKIIYKGYTFRYEFFKRNHKVIIYFTEPVKLKNVRIVNRIIYQKIKAQAGNNNILFDFKSKLAY